MKYTIDSLHQAYDQQEVSVSEVVTAYTKRIAQLNPTLNAYLTVDEEAIAEQVSKLPKYDKHRFPLWGVPISVKDNYCTKGMRTTASSNVLKNFVPQYDATVIRKLREAGAILLGKTNMDAWAHGSSTETSDFGPTKNPHDLTRMPGGSSGGAAASVAADLCVAAVGTETAGSIRQPASWCGVIGLKPTYGRVSRYGVIAMASSTDSPGPITKTVPDASRILRVIAGHDPLDATSLPDTLADTSETKKTVTIGWSSTYLEGVSPEVKRGFEKTLQALEQKGHRIQEIDLMSPQLSIAVYTVIQRAEVSSNLARFDGIRYGNPRSAFGSEAKKRIMLGTFVLSVGYFDAYYLKAQKVRTLIINDFKRAFKTVDAILAPTAPTTALKLGESAKYPFFGEIMDVLVEPSAIAGLPGISFPVGKDDHNLPIGMQLLAPWKEEGRLLQLTQALNPMVEQIDLKREMAA
ncbi:MAG: Asp-tRNA(Asn)/Glu-tRNA(Gln) amidotransferase subunit GatA [Candidatus Roizmanbacteria bacterium]|nr:Asp-tRNA(Asn)/Glu-tRNA(Gln) amidotransferase subunit GatA [Candidatus Roizmanbacteria bacterium]